MIIAKEVMDINEVILYTTHCPKCRVLKEKLDMCDIDYNECNDVEVMRQLNITHVPVLSIAGTLYEYKQAINLISKGGCGSEHSN